MSLVQLRKYTPHFICLILALLVAGKALYPGYILLLDMGWAPTFPVSWSKDAFNNVYPVYAIIHFLTLMMPSWVVQKIFFLVMLTTLFYMPWRYLPYITNNYARAFAVGVFALNPFVYARILSGQWFHVIGYVVLPFLLYALVQLVRESDRGSGNVERRAVAHLVIALVAIGLFSIHILYLACVVTGIWLLSHILYSWWNERMVKSQKSSNIKVDIDANNFQNTVLKVNTNTKKLFLSSLLVSLFFIICSLYWIAPAYTRTATLESRFDNKHFVAFAAASNKDIPVMNNVLALGGFWGEGLAWRYFYVFPQEREMFWVAIGLIFLFVLLGVWTMLRDTRTRLAGIILLSIGILAYITALGASVTPFRAFNMLLYEYIPFWNGLRDSHKIVGVLALVYAVLSGIGVQTLISKVQVSRFKFLVNQNVLSALLFIPMTYGMYMWGGLHNQLQSVYYPHEWKEVKKDLVSSSQGERVLVLPWESYLSMPFAHDRLIANPLEAYFGKDLVMTSRDVGMGGIHDQEVDMEYRAIDTLVTNAYQIQGDDLVDTLKAYGIYGVLIINNPSIDDADKGMTKWTQYGEDSLATSTPEKEKLWIDILPKNITKKVYGNSLILLNFQ